MRCMSERISIDELKDRVEGKTHLKINKAPERVIEEFKQLAHDSFGDDYGMTLTFLLDGYFESNQILQTISLGLIDHEQRISRIEEGKPQDNKDKDKTIKTFSGRVINNG